MGIGLVFGSLIEATARNPSLQDVFFRFAILGFALAEATLRRCRYFILSYYYDILPANQRGNGLTRVALVNEPGLQGLGINEKVTGFNKLLTYCRISCSECLEVFLSLTKVNCQIKTGSSARVLSKILVTLKNKWQLDNCGVLTGLVHSSYPEQTETQCYIRDLQNYKINLISSNKIFNIGNPGNINNHMIFEVSYKIIIVLSSTFLYSKSYRLEKGNRNGGKIIEKANALANTNDSMFKGKIKGD